MMLLKYVLLTGKYYQKSVMYNRTIKRDEICLNVFSAFLMRHKMQSFWICVAKIKLVSVSDGFHSL